MLGLAPKRSSRDGFKKLDILTVPSLHIFSLIMFVVINPDHFKSNSYLQGIYTRQNSTTFTISKKFSSIQMGVTYSSIKIFNKLPLNKSKLHRHSITFKPALMKFPVKNAFYSKEESLFINCDVN